MKSFLDKLSEWFGDSKYEYVVIHKTESECVFVTISESLKEEWRNIEIYRVFKVGNNLEISCDLQYDINLKRDSSILGAIADVIKTYEKIK